MQYSEVFTIRNFYYLGLLTIAASLPLSPYFTSIGQWIIILAWFADKNFVQKIKTIKDKKSLIFFLSFYVLHIFSLLWSSNIQYGLHDIKIKLPLLILPLIISTTKPLNKKELHGLFWIYCAAVITVSLIGFHSIYFTKGGLTADFRSISPFISHIRYSLMVNLAIVILLYIAYEQKQTTLKLKIAISVMVIYLILFLILMRSLTGIVAFLAMTTVVLIYKINKIGKPTTRKIVNGTFIAIALIFAIYLQQAYSRYHYKADNNLKQLKQTTINGNPYKHDTLSIFRENGYLVQINICENEMRTEWNKRGFTKYDSISINGYPIKSTLIRYLTSKGLKKDSIGVSKLTEIDISAIENGIANHLYLNRFSLYPRLYELFWEMDYYKRGGNPSGHSVIQRLYYITAGWNIFIDNPIIGVGVGDVDDAFQEYYNKTNSLITPEWRLRAHNQYLTILLTFGIIGFFIFSFSQIYPVIESKNNKILFILFTPFIVTILLSMINEDTFETQAGVTFYAFFYSLFIWGINKKTYSDYESK